MKLPTLYKKTSTGAIQYWTISVEETYVERPIGTMTAGTIITDYGQVGTGNPQQTRDLIVHGKNIGKKNETTAFEQAIAEAKSKHEKQRKRGYVDSSDGAAAGDTDDLIEGGIIPMLAHKFTEQAHKIKYPAFVQPKLDGIRCVAIVKDGIATLWTRTRKPITSCPHIIKELQMTFQKQDIVLDGELYNHELKSDFEKIVSMVRQEEPAEGHEVIQYHVYDLISKDTFKFRNAGMTRLFRFCEFDTMKLVQTDIVNAEEDVMEYFDKYRTKGYEGAMLRNADSEYVNKRSYDLQKVKEFDDAEFRIVGIEEGRGKLAGHVGSFICEMDGGKQFLAKAKGSTDNLRLYFENHSLWQGKKLTVQYQGLTGKERVPRFPVGIALRDYE